MRFDNFKVLLALLVMSISLPLAVAQQLVDCRVR
jgi:hypothetical protein